jgi:hypothetical protein
MVLADKRKRAVSCGKVCSHGHEVLALAAAVQHVKVKQEGAVGMLSLFQMHLCFVNIGRVVVAMPGLIVRRIVGVQSKRASERSVSSRVLDGIRPSHSVFQHRPNAFVGLCVRSAVSLMIDVVQVPRRVCVIGDDECQVFSCRVCV